MPATAANTVFSSMGGRLYHLLVLAFWAASMTWLVVEKVVPPLLGGRPPDYRAVLARDDPSPDCWRIIWKDRKIGFAASQVIRHADAVREMRSVVQFEDLPLESVLSELLGVFAKFTANLLGENRDYRINALLATQMMFDDQRQLQRFRTLVDIGDQPGLMSIYGNVTPGRRLQVIAQLGKTLAESPAVGESQVFRREIELPPQALVSDSLTPRAELKNLTVGQTWTIPVYRLFPPNSPVQIIEAKVERHEILVWEGNDVETLLIVYRSDAGSGLLATRGPVGSEWVRSDGTVLCQEVVFSGLHLRFERLPLDTQDPRRQLLDEQQHPRLWSHADDSLPSSPPGPP